jgi:hypothetical protein
MTIAHHFWSPRYAKVNSAASAAADVCHGIFHELAGNSAVDLGPALGLVGCSAAPSMLWSVKSIFTIDKNDAGNAGNLRNLDFTEHHQ